jgi:hypothetical protein
MSKAKKQRRIMEAVTKQQQAENQSIARILQRI